MKACQNNWLPHIDPFSVACNMYLTQNDNTGTSFLRFISTEGKAYYNSTQLGRSREATQEYINKYEWSVESKERFSKNTVEGTDISDWVYYEGDPPDEPLPRFERYHYIKVDRINIKNSYIKKYNIISCPGCYPTSILLPLFPLFKKNLIKFNNIIIDSKSGYSGAGRGVHKKYKDKNLYESLSAYGVGFHRHNSEIDQMLRKFTKKKFQFSFTPHLSPMFRGILSTIYVDLENNISQTKVLKTLISFYKNESFVKILKSGTLLSTNDVINTNNCYISVCKSKYSNKIIILSANDNLIN